jgi:hypothetical protein
MGASLLGSLASISQNIVTIERDLPVSGKRRRVAPSKRQKRGSKYRPHYGAKEQERAKRLYESRFLNERFASIAQFMHPNLPSEMCHPRATPTLCQMSKRDYCGQPF